MVHWQENMPTIRKEQMNVFIGVERKKFEDWMVVHVNEFFPQQFQSLGEPKMRETIQYGKVGVAG